MKLVFQLIPNYCLSPDAFSANYCTNHRKLCSCAWKTTWNNQISKQIWPENNTWKNQSTIIWGKCLLYSWQVESSQEKRAQKKRHTLFLPVSGGQRGPPTTRPNQSNNKSLYIICVHIKHLMGNCDRRSFCNISGRRQQALSKCVTDKQQQCSVWESKPEGWARLDLHLGWSAADNEMKRRQTTTLLLEKSKSHSWAHEGQIHQAPSQRGRS